MKKRNEKGTHSPKEFYRYYDCLYSWDYLFNVPQVKIILNIYYLVKETPCGYWISSSPYYNKSGIRFKEDKPKWISKTSRKRFAYPTKKEALISFKARKNRQIAILTRQLEQAKSALSEVYKMNENFKIRK